MQDDLKIISNGMVLGCNEGNNGGRSTILVRNGIIEEVTGSDEGLEGPGSLARVIDATGKLIVPGFVNAHVHSESIILRGRGRPPAFDAGAVLATVGNPGRLENFYRAAALSHLRAGTTCFCEFLPRLPEGSLPLILNGIDRSDLKSRVVLGDWAQIRECRSLGDRLRDLSIGLEDTDEFTVYGLESRTAAADELGVPVFLHVGETAEAYERIRRLFQRNLAWVLRYHKLLGPGRLPAHLNQLSPAEAETVRSTSVPFVVSPRSAAYKSAGYPSLRYLLSEPGKGALGTDWSNFDMMAEMRFLGQLPLILEDFPALSDLDIVKMATLSAARAIGLGDSIGSIEKGKSADMAFFDIRDGSLPPLPPNPTSEDLARLVVHELDSRHLRHVMVNGNFLMFDGNVLSASGEELFAEFGTMLEEVLGKHPYPAGGQPGVPSALLLKDSAVGGGSTVRSHGKGYDPRPELPKNVRRVYGEDD